MIPLCCFSPRKVNKALPHLAGLGQKGTHPRPAYCLTTYVDPDVRVVERETAKDRVDPARYLLSVSINQKEKEFFDVRTRQGKDMRVVSISLQILRGHEHI